MKIVIEVLLLTAWLFIACSKSVQAQSGGDTGTRANTATAGTDTQSAQEAKEAADLDLDQLANMDVKVTSASKKSESLFGAPAAIFVLSGEEIRQRGLSSIPDALSTTAQYRTWRYPR